MKARQGTEKEFYDRDGFVVPDYRLPAPVISQLQSLTMELFNENPFMTRAPYPSPHVNYSGRHGDRGKVRGRRPQEWMTIATHPDILDIVERIIGPDIIMWGTTLFFKRAEKGPSTPWHRDGPHWPIRPMATTSVWISVFDSKADNGCLRCIPGSHKAQDWGRHFHTDEPNVISPLTIAADEFDESKARDVELEPGEMVIFDVRTIHGARHNFGARPRAGYTLRLIPASSHYDHDLTRQRRESAEIYERKERDFDYALRPLFLVRGTDRSGLNDFRRNHSPDESMAASASGKSIAASAR